MNSLCDFIMTFWANPHFIFQISHAKTFKMKYARCPYNNIIQKYSQRQIICGSNFDESDFMKGGHNIDVPMNSRKPKLLKTKNKKVYFSICNKQVSSNYLKTKSK